MKTYVKAQFAETQRIMDEMLSDAYLITRVERAAQACVKSLAGRR